jgi:hypothetical protein
VYKWSLFSVLAGQSGIPWSEFARVAREIGGRRS